MYKLWISLSKIWEISKETQQDIPGQGRTFRRQIADFWEIWPMPPKIETPRDVVFVDGIYLAKKACISYAANSDPHCGRF